MDDQVVIQAIRREPLVGVWDGMTRKTFPVDFTRDFEDI